jgi:HTH-type transcriptional regulator / antitoxin HipB
MKKNLNISTFSEHLNKQYGKRGTKKREKYEQEFEAFKLGVMLQDLRKELGMTQEQLAAKCGTTKTLKRIYQESKTMQVIYAFLLSCELLAMV